jgi:TonB-linked SusC/RagA family outer membrane protein
LLLFCTFSISGNVLSQKVSLDLQNVTIRQAFDEIETLTGYKFFYLAEQIDDTRRIDLHASDQTVEDIILELFNKESIRYKIFENNLVVITPATKILQQGITVVGSVKSGMTNIPLPGVNVVEKGTMNGTTTDLDGNFTITVKNEDALLVFSYVGYLPEEKTIGGQTILNISMTEDITSLEEVVVIGYGVQKKKLNTGATINIKGDEIQKLNTATPMDALKGISAGVSVIQNNGVPGSGTKVLIRGAGTIDNAKPLYIVDGISVADIDFLAPSDIESIDVLKDAASAAIYGSRAANGVILVTTKRGNFEKKPVISYNFYYGWQRIAKKPESLNAQEYVKLMDEAQANSDLEPLDWESLVPNWAEIESGENKGTKWFEEVYNENAPVQDHSVNIYGGNKGSMYALGFNYFTQEGIIGKQINNVYKRINIRLNSEHKLINHNDRNILKVGQNLSYSNFKKPAIRTGDLYSNDLHNMLVTSPLLPMYAIDSSDRSYPYHYAIDWNPFQANPVALMIYQSKYKTNNNNVLVGNVYLDIEPLKNLVFHSSYGFNSRFGSSRSWRPAYELAEASLELRDNVAQQTWLGYTWTWTNTLAYSFNVAKNHNISVMVGQESTKNSINERLSTSNDSSVFNDYEHAYISNTEVMNIAYINIEGRDDFGWAMLSYFGRLSYDYKETFLATFVLRADGSSNFTEDNRWGIFPSVSLGYILSNHSFIQKIPGLNYFKLRGSWGQNGNQDIAQFQYLSSLSTSYSDYVFGTDYKTRSIGAYPARVPNPDVTWETSEQTDLGFDARFLNNKLELNFDLYKKVTSDWLVVAPQLATNGTSAPYINGGEISNKGLELVLNWKESRGEFRYGANFSWAHNKNEVVAIANDEGIIHGASHVLITNTAELFRAEVGYPIGYFWGYKTNGIIQNEVEAANYVNSVGTPYFKNTKPGDVRFVDLNNDGVINEEDKTMIGDPNPDNIFGIQLNGEYKGFYAFINAYAHTGQQIAKSYRTGGSKANFTPPDLGRWHGEGTSDRLPRLDASYHQRNNLWVSDIYIYDADFLRISDLTFGYDVGRLVSKSLLQEARIYFSVKNLHTFTKYSGLDPEVGYGPTGFNWASGIDLGLYPASKTYMVGLNLKF